jgi:hypothetical protein
MRVFAPMNHYGIVEVGSTTENDLQRVQLKHDFRCYS